MKSGLETQSAVNGGDARASAALWSTAKSEIDLDMVWRVLRRLVVAPKNREADYLITSAALHPSFQVAREDCGRLNTHDLIETLAGPRELLVTKAVAALHLFGGPVRRALKSSDLECLKAALTRMGTEAELLSGVEHALRKYREPMVAMVPIIAAAIREACETPTVTETPVAPSPVCLGIPLYAFDKHTHLGKRAIALLVRRDRVVRECLAAYVPEFRSNDVAAMAAFYVDAIPLGRQARWSQSDALEAIGRETDFMKVGCPPAGVQPTLDVIRASLDHLNDIRIELLGRRTCAQLELRLDDSNGSNLR